MPLRGPTCKRVLARIQARLNFKLDPSVANISDKLKHFCSIFESVSIENLRDLSKNALTLSVFELKRCSFFK